MLQSMQVNAERTTPPLLAPSGVLATQVSRRWFALYTRHQFEKSVHRDLSQMGLESYLPLRSVLRRWSDRKKWIEEPLFSCYVFVHVTPKERLMSLAPNGVVRMLCSSGQPSRIGDDEIELVRRIAAAEFDPEPASNLVLGDLLEVVGGPLQGVQGRLRAMHGEHRLIISFDSIGQSVAIKIDRSRVRKVGEESARHLLSA
jgi:transcription antitermination factor NusG